MEHGGPTVFDVLKPPQPPPHQVQQQQAAAAQHHVSEDRALQYCNYVFEVVLNLGTSFGFQAHHRCSISSCTPGGKMSKHVPSTIYVVADHLSRVLLDDVAARTCITDKLPLDLAFREAVWTVHGKFTAGYVRWTQQLQLPARPVDQQVIDPSSRYTDDSVIRMLLCEVGLMLLLHTEAASLHQLPSSCCLLYWLLRSSQVFKHAVEGTALLSHPAGWSAAWNNRDMILEVHAMAAEALSSMGQPALAEVEREWALRKDAGHHPFRVLSGLVAQAAAGKGAGTMGAQDALRVAYVFSACDAAVLLEEVLQPLCLLLSYMEAHVPTSRWPCVLSLLEQQLQTPAVLRHALGSLSVVDCHRAAPTFTALRELGRTADGGFDARLAAAWWEQLLLEGIAPPGCALRGSSTQFGSTWHLVSSAFLLVQGTFAVTLSLGPVKHTPVCWSVEQANCMSVSSMAWSSLLLSHAAFRVAETAVAHHDQRYMRHLPRITDSFTSDLAAAARAKQSALPSGAPIGLKGPADEPPNWPRVVSAGQLLGRCHSALVHSVWSNVAWFALLLATFVLLFAPGGVGRGFEYLWWALAGVHLCLVAVSLAQDWQAWRQEAPEWHAVSFCTRVYSFISAWLWFGLLFALPCMAVWLLGLPANQAVGRMVWAHHAWSHSTAAAATSGGPLVLLMVSTVLTNLLGGIILLLLLSMALRILGWTWQAGHLLAPLRAHNSSKWEELCGCFEELAETWCTKCLPRQQMEEEAVGPNAGRFPVVWNGLVEDLVQRDLLASSEGETLAYTRIINVTTPSLLNSLGLPDMMPPAFVVGPALHQWLQQKANPTAVVTQQIVQVLRLLLLLLHHADVLTTSELVVMSTAVEEGSRVAKRQHVAIKHILVEGMKIVSWSYKGGLQPNSSWLDMVKKHSKMTDAIFNFIAAFSLGVAPSAAVIESNMPSSPSGTPREASAAHVAVSSMGVLSDSVTSLHRSKGRQRTTSDVSEAGEVESESDGADLSILIVDRHSEAAEEAAKVTTLISRQLPAVRTKPAGGAAVGAAAAAGRKALDNASREDGDTDSESTLGGDAEPSTPACSELDFGGGLYTPRSECSTDTGSPMSMPATPREGSRDGVREGFREEPRERERKGRGQRSGGHRSSGQRRKKGHDAPPPPPLVARLLRRTMGKSQYFMALCLYMVKLRRTPSWSKSEPEVNAAAEELVSFLESVFHPALGEEPAPPALTIPSLTSVLPLQPGQEVLPLQQKPAKPRRPSSEAESKNALLDQEGPAPPPGSHPSVTSDLCNALFTSDGRPSRLLSRLLRRHHPEWQNFQERIAAQTGVVPLDVRPRCFLKGGSLHRYQWDFLMWVGLRSGALAHQVRGLSSLHRATPTLLTAERPLSLAVGPKVYALWLEAVADLKFQSIILAPHLCQHMDANEPQQRWNAQATVSLLNRHSFMRAVAVHKELPGRQRSGSGAAADAGAGGAGAGAPAHHSFTMLLRGRHNIPHASGLQAEDTAHSSGNGTSHTPGTPAKHSKHRIPDTADMTTADMVAMYAVKLPHNPYSSGGAAAAAGWLAGPAATAGTSPLVRPFVFTEYVQSCNLGMANLGLAPALLIRHMLNALHGRDPYANVFMGSITSVTVPAHVDRAGSMAGGETGSLRGWVMSHGPGSRTEDHRSDAVSVSSASMQDFIVSGGTAFSQRVGLPPIPVPASPSLGAVGMRTPSMHSSSGFSLMMQGTMQSFQSSGSPLSTPRMSSLTPWAQWQKSTVGQDGDASSVAHQSSVGRELLAGLLNTQDTAGTITELNTPRSLTGFQDRRRTSHTDTTELDPSMWLSDSISCPPSPEGTRSHSPSQPGHPHPAAASTPIPMQLRALDQMLLPPAPALQDGPIPHSTSSLSAAGQPGGDNLVHLTPPLSIATHLPSLPTLPGSRMEAATPRLEPAAAAAAAAGSPAAMAPLPGRPGGLPAVKTHVKPPPASPPKPGSTLQSTGSLSRTADSLSLFSGGAMSHSGSSLRVSGGGHGTLLEPDTAKSQSAVTINSVLNSVVPHADSVMGGQMQDGLDDGQPLLSSAAAVVEQRFVMAAALSRRLAGVVSGRFVSKRGIVAGRHFAALSNLLCLPAQVLGWQPATLCIQDKTCDMGPGPGEPTACDGSVSWAAGWPPGRLGGWVCRYIMVDMIGPQTTEELADLMLPLLGSRQVPWLCQEAERSSCWLQKVLLCHAHAVLWAMRLLLLYIPLRSLVQLLAPPAHWSHTLYAGTPPQFILPGWDSNSRVRLGLDLGLALGGLLLFLPLLQALFMGLLHGRTAVWRASHDLMLGWLPAATTLLLCSLPDAAAAGRGGEPSKGACTPAAAAAAGGCATSAGVDSGSGRQQQVLLRWGPFVHLYCRWGRRAWGYALWIMALGGLVIASLASATLLSPSVIFSTATSGILPLLLGALLLLGPLCLQHGPAQHVLTVAENSWAWCCWMGESLGRLAARGSWADMHHAGLPRVLSSRLAAAAWLAELLSKGTAAAVMCWYGVWQLQHLPAIQAALSLEVLPAPGSSTPGSPSNPISTSTPAGSGLPWSGDLLSSASQAVTSQQGMTPKNALLVDLLVRGGVAWVAVLLLLAASHWCVRLGSRMLWPATKGAMAVLLLLAPPAVFVACFWQVLGAAGGPMPAILACYIILACNAAAGSFVCSLLHPLQLPVLSTVSCLLCWYGDMLAGTLALLLWSVLALLDPLYWYVKDAVHAGHMCWARMRRRTAPQDDVN